jgi:hypothetical protein
LEDWLAPTETQFLAVAGDLTVFESAMVSVQHRTETGTTTNPEKRTWTTIAIRK